MKKYNLSFSYKGARDYIQGPDIFDAALKKLKDDFSDITEVKYSAHDWIRNQAVMIVDSTDVNQEYNSKITFKSANVKHSALIIDNGESVKERNEYSESYVFENLKISDKTIELYNTQHLSFSELIVSMNKCYLQSLGFKGKWIVTKLEYLSIALIQDYFEKTITIRLLKNLNNKLTKSEVYIENEKVGLIYFSLI